MRDMPRNSNLKICAGPGCEMYAQEGCLTIGILCPRWTLCDLHVSSSSYITPLLVWFFTAHLPLPPPSLHEVHELLYLGDDIVTYLT